jgi:hypothetical protein
MAFLFVVKDLDTVDVWPNGHDPDSRVVLAHTSFLMFMSVCQQLGVPCLEVVDSDLVVEGLPN